MSEYADTMTLDEYLQAIKETGNKFGSRIVKKDGYTFQSQAEADRYGELLLMARNGDIQHLIIHPKYIVIPAFTYHGEVVEQTAYVADFSYELDGVTVVEDVKGGKATQTEAFKIKAKLFKRNYPLIDFRIVER